MALLLAFIPICAVADDTSSDSPPPSPPVITSGNLIVVMSAENGQILLNTANGKEVDPTCATKLMTAMIAFDLAGGLDKEVTVESAALKGIGAAGDISAPMLGLTPGSVFTVRQLLQATLISAANDACNALAYYCSGGDIPAFVEKMNERAKEIGCTHTYFTNTTGLYDGEAYTTVEDVAKIAAAFYRYNTLLDISSQPSYVIGGSTVHSKNYLRSETLMKGCTIPTSKGMIAGQRTAKSDYCLITAAESGGLGMVYVIMEAPGEIRNTDGTREFPENNAYSDMKLIFDWYKSSYGYVALAKKGEIAGEIEVDVAADSMDHVTFVVEETVERLMLKGTDSQQFKRVINLTEKTLSAPIKKGTVVGTMDIFDGEELLATVNLVTSSAVERSELLVLFGKVKSFLFGPTMKTVTRVLLAIIIAFVVFTVGAKVYYVVNRAKKELERRELARRNAEAFGLSKDSRRGNDRQGTSRPQQRQSRGLPSSGQKTDPKSDGDGRQPPQQR